MSIKSEYTKLIIKDKLLNAWYGFWKVIGKLLSKPYNYIYDKRVEKWSDPNNYNKIKLLKVINKRIAKRLMYTEIYLVDSNATYHDRDSDIDLPYNFMEYSKNKYMARYRSYAYENDKNTNWCKLIIENLDSVNIKCVKGKDVISQWSYDYKNYKDTDVYIIKLKED